MSDFDTWIDNWLDKEVEFTLFGLRLCGRVIEAMDTVCVPMFLVAELQDGSKQVKVGAPYQAFRRIGIQEAGSE